MTAITSGTYGLQPTFSTGAIRKLVAGFFGATRTRKPAASIQAARPVGSLRARVREANDVRELARSVELHSPGFAADLYAAALRHEGYDD